MSILTIAALSMSLELGPARFYDNARDPLKAPRAECAITTVSYRFVGQPGTEFRYADESYLVPAAGSIEILAMKGVTSYDLDGRKLRIESGKNDEFGLRTVSLPRFIALLNQ